MDNFSKNLASNILAYREKRNWSQMDLAKHIGIPRASVAKLESGGANPSLSNMILISKALEKSIEELSTKPVPSIQIHKITSAKAFQVLPSCFSMSKLELKVYQSQTLKKFQGGRLVILCLSGGLQLESDQAEFKLNKNQWVEMQGVDSLKVTAYLDESICLIKKYELQ